jgi:hypothetical protein
MCYTSKDVHKAERGARRTRDESRERREAREAKERIGKTPTPREGDRELVRA